MRPKVFWDSCALISAIRSRKMDSPGRILLRLGETGAVDYRVSHEVLGDCDRVLRREDVLLVKQLAAILYRAKFAIAPSPNSETVEQCVKMTGYEPDARVLAAAIECDADLFLTLDREHFFDNPLISLPDTRINVVTLHRGLDMVKELLDDLANGDVEKHILD